MDYRALIAVILGALVLVWPGSLSARASSEHEQRLAELRSGADEAFFEEKRSLEAYRPRRRELTWRLLGAGLLAGGLWMLFGARD